MQLRLVVLAAVVAAGLCLAASAWGAGQALCVGGSGTAVTTPGSGGTCPAGKTLVTLATQSEVNTLQSQVAALQAKLSKVSYSASGVNGKPTVKISGANLQVVNGAGKTDAAVNGVGNVIIGYDESPGHQTGSHNLVLGYHQSYTSWGGVLGGVDNSLGGAASVVFGSHNDAAGTATSVTGGEYNLADDFYAAITGGCDNLAGFGSSLGGSCSGAGWESVTGGAYGSARGVGSSVSGGYFNTALGSDASILGGIGNSLSSNCATFPSSGQSCP
jgi:hypothetical protein